MFLIIDNYDSFTFNLVQSFLQLGRDPLIVKNDDPALLDLAANKDLEMVCISPGPGRPENAGYCLEFLCRLPKEVPVLGVCLGHQVLGHFAGARVEVGPRIMHGFQSEAAHLGDGLFQGIVSPMTVGRYHSLVVRAEDVPDILEISAVSTTPEGVEEVMAIRFKDRPWAGIQFHPESVLSPEGLRLLANFPSALLSESSGISVTAGNARERTANGSKAPVQMSTVIEALASGKDLEPEVAAEAFSRLMDGELSPSQAGAFLLGLRAKGETPEEVSEAVRAVLDRAVPVPPVNGKCIDIVGTGGDNKSSFNCSTATSLTLAALGHKVLKHGNRSVSSSCGSADVLEQLGIAVDTSPEAVPRALDKEGFVFLFAPRYHPAFRHVMPIRRELGVRTLFNILGPLVNPAKPTHHFLGVPGEAQLSLVAETLARTSSGKGAVVHGAGGYDELTCLGEAKLVFVENGQTRPGKLNPADYGFEPSPEHELTVSGPEDAAEVLTEILQGRGPKAMKDMLALNLGFALYLMRAEPDDGYDPDCGYNRELMNAAMNEARLAVETGAGRRYCNA